MPYLKTEHLLIKPKKNHFKTTNPKHWLRKYPNLLKHIANTKPNHFYVSDITNIKSKEKTHYLFLATDAYYRKISIKWYECRKYSKSYLIW